MSKIFLVIIFLLTSRCQSKHFKSFLPDELSNHAFAPDYLGSENLAINPETQETKERSYGTTKDTIPTTTKPSDIGTWFIKDKESNVTCVMVNAKLSLEIRYEVGNGSSGVAILTVPNDAQSFGECGHKGQSMILQWNASNKYRSQRTISILFNMVNNQSYAITDLKATVEIDPLIFPGRDNAVGNILKLEAINISNFIQIQLANSYICNAEHGIMMQGLFNNYNATLIVSNLQFEAFHDSTQETFDTATHCLLVDNSNPLVPYAIVCSLAALVVIVAVAFFVSRKRSSRRSYQPLRSTDSPKPSTSSMATDSSVKPTIEAIDGSAKIMDSSTKPTMKTSESPTKATVEATENSTKKTDSSTKATTKTTDSPINTTTKATDSSTQGTDSSTDNSTKATIKANESSAKTTTKATDSSAKTTTKATDSPINTTTKAIDSSTKGTDSSTKATTKAPDSSTKATTNVTDSSAKATDSSTNATDSSTKAATKATDS